MANRTDPAAKSIRETNYQKLVDKGMELETHPHKDIFVEFIKNQVAMSCRSRLVSSINMEMRGMEKTISKMKKASGFEDAYLHNTH